MVLYFYAIYLLCTRPHDERFVQVYMLIMSILMLPWGLVLIFTFFASATAAHNRRVSSSNDETKTASHAHATVFLAGSSCYSLWPLKQCETHPQEF
jgi:hypothetical protein